MTVMKIRPLEFHVHTQQQIDDDIIYRTHNVMTTTPNSAKTIARSIEPLVDILCVYPSKYSK